MRYFYLLIAFTCLASFASCNGNDDEPDAPVYERPVWLELNYPPGTGSPQDQIDNFVNANNLDTTETTSGLIYKILDPGDPEKPAADAAVLLFYKGYFVDGSVFDATGASPSALRLNTLIPGWREGVPLIGEGGRIMLIIRPRLGYGNQGSGSITPTSVIVFEIQMEDFVNP